MKQLIAGAGVIALVSGAVTVQSQTPTPTELFFSEYIEGSSFNKALEIYNGTGAAVDLAAGGYNVQMYFNGAFSAQLTIQLTGTVATGDVFVLAQSQANAAILAQADQTSASSWYNGDDTVVLRRGTTVIDVIGQVAFDPGTEWGTGLVSTSDNTIRRRASICAGDPTASDAFDPAVEWDGFAIDTVDGLGTHAVACAATDTAPEVVATLPANGAADVPVNGTLTVTFSESVRVADGGFTLSCAVSGSVPLTVSGGPVAFTLDPVRDLAPGESCSLRIAGAQVTDQDANDPPDAMAADAIVVFTTAVPTDACALPFTPIYAIQGDGATAAISGTVTTQGVVVGDYEGPAPALRGFYIQDPSGDGDPATSDGIFVFNGNNDSVNLGDLVRVTGTVAEFQFQTQIGSVTAIRACGTGSVTATEVMLPAPDADFFERFEGMLVRLPQALVVTEHFQLGRFGQVVLSSGERLPQPTSIATPGAAALARQTANDLNRIVLDDATQVQNPDPIVFARGGLPLSAANTLRGGDTATGIVGVMTYTWAGNAASGNAWRVRPLSALGGTATFEAANPRPESVPDVGGALKVAGLNLLNYFNTFDGAGSAPPFACTAGAGGTPVDCRGADDVAEFDRQWPKTVAAILGAGADIVGVVELENDGYGPESAIADLVARLNAATAPGTYAFIDVDAATEMVNALGTDAIKVGILYKPANAMPVGVTAALNSPAFVNGGDVEARNRPSLAQAFQTRTGGRVVVVVNHLKSKGSACDTPDAGDGQGACNVVRTAAATELAAWLSTDPTGAGDARVLLVGDFNAYAQEDPIRALQSEGFVNLIDDRNGPSSYSYVFDGQWGYLDHALASPALSGDVTGVGEYHINADEPSVLDYNDDFKSPGQVTSLYAPDEFRAADHDPVIVGLDLDNRLAGGVSGWGWLDQPLAQATGKSTRHHRWWRFGKVKFFVTADNRRRSTVPKGAVLVQFDRSAVFTSTSMQWLTVSDGQAIVQGRGAIGVDHNYAFRVTAIDGRRAQGRDRVRIQIWSTSTGEVVFDSGADADVRGGSIVVRAR
jgi:predicted extracellular nuclease